MVEPDEFSKVYAFIDIVYLEMCFCVLGDAPNVNEVWCGLDKVVGVVIH